MGGYNTICELAYAGASALIVPRTSPRREQLLRAQRLAERGVVHLLLPEAALPDVLIREVLEGFGRPRPPRRWGLDFSGLETICRAVAVQRQTQLALQLGRRVASVPNLPERSFSGPALPARFLDGVPARAPGGGGGPRVRLHSTSCPFRLPSGDDRDVRGPPGRRSIYLHRPRQGYLLEKQFPAVPQNRHLPGGTGGHR